MANEPVHAGRTKLIVALISAAAVIMAALITAAVTLYTSAPPDDTQTKVDDRDGVDAKLGSQVPTSRSTTRSEVIAVDRETGLGTVQKPVPLEFFRTVQVSLGQNERCTFYIALPAGRFKTVLDTRVADRRSTKLTSHVSLLDSDGAVIGKNLLRINVTSFGHRATHDSTRRKPDEVGLQLVNDARAVADFWLTILQMPEAPENSVNVADLGRFEPSKAHLVPIPFYGEVVPAVVPIGEEQSGELEQNEAVYYMVVLSKENRYKLVLQTDHIENESGNLTAAVFILDSDGGGQERVLRINERSASFRKAAHLPRRAGPCILRIVNSHRTVRYTLFLRQD